ncbi:STE20-related kinase adapter protein alpha [Dirofilaria immitis]|nr:STE20-related kinase adapter protein alpha [Dirofilaria immitis]
MISSPADFTVCGTLGKACSGLSDVLLVKRLTDESLAALRILPTEKMDYEKIKDEVWFLKWLSHPCIISINQIISVESDVYIFSTFCDLCSVLHVVHNHYPYGLPEKLLLKSIRCSHILLHSTGIVKLTGFRHCLFLRYNELTGTNNILHDFDAEISNDLLWLAPEILRQDLYGYGLSSDVYSIGITICEMANGFPPFSDMNRLQALKGTTPRLLDCTTLSDKDEIERDQQFRQRRRFSDSLHIITDYCLKPLPENRWSVSKLLTHPFVKSIRKNRSFSSLLPDIA